LNVRLLIVEARLFADRLDDFSFDGPDLKDQAAQLRCCTAR
jgi:hypothetical protein